MTAQSDGVGRGATFIVVLPAAAAGNADSRLVDMLHQTAIPHRRFNILLVEDHRDTAQTLCESLMARGHRVRVAGGVQAALREAAADPCELLISDIGLPDGSGTDLIRHMHPPPTIGAIAMSGFAMEQDLLRSRDAGFHSHLTKPVEFATLERAIAEVSNGKRRDAVVGRRPRRGRSRSR